MWKTNSNKNNVLGGIYIKEQYKYIILIFTIAIILPMFFSQSINKRMSKSLGIEIPGNIKIDYEDTHGGFHGDGDTTAVVQFDKSIAENIRSEIENNMDWNSLPLSESLDILMYGGVKEGTNYTYNYAELLNMPRIENGYWFYEDRQPESILSSEDQDLFPRLSYNFTIAIYDLDTDTLYYLENDI